MAYALGIDVSRWQGEMKWDVAKAAGAKFSFIRAGSITATAGELYSDYQFERNSSIAPNFLPVGYYWFFRPEHNSILQAEYFCNLIEGKGAKLPAVLDVESNDQNVSEFIYRLRVKLALEYIESRTGRTPIVYTRASVWNPWLGAEIWMQKYPLWVAHYTEIYPQPYIPYAWIDWKFWQWSADKPPNMRGAEFGADSPSIDINYYNGDDSAFEAYVGWPPLPQPPPMEIPMFEGEFDVQQISQRTIVGDNMQEVIIPADEGWVVQYLGMTTNVTSKIDRARLEIEPSGKMAFIVNKSATIEPKTWYPHNAVYNLLPGSKIRMKYYCPVEGAYATLRYYVRKIKLV